MAAAPVFVGTPKTWMNALSAANTERIYSAGTMVDIIPTPGASGSRVDAVKAIASATVSPGVVRLWLNDGTNRRLVREIMVEATTPSTSAEVWSKDVIFPVGLIVPNGWKLQASTHNAENFNVIAQGGDL